MNRIEILSAAKRLADLYGGTKGSKPANKHARRYWRRAIRENLDSVGPEETRNHIKEVVDFGLKDGLQYIVQ